MAVELVLHQRVNALRRALPAVKRGDVTAIHHARVATRRLREALALSGDSGTSRKTEAIVRRLTRALGPVRELDVTLQILDGLAADGEMSPQAAAFLGHALRDERSRLHDSLVRAVDDCDIDKLRRKITSSPGTVPRRRAVDPKRLAAARARAVRRATTLRDTMDHAAAIYLPDRLHEVRIAVKKLRYAMEIVRELSRSRATAQLKRLKTAQDLLGRMHDLEMLIARTRGIQGASGAPDLRVSADLDHLVRRLENECRRLHGDYIESRHELTRLTEQVIAGVKPRRRAAA